MMKVAYSPEQADIIRCDSFRVLEQLHENFVYEAVKLSNAIHERE